MTDQPDHMAAGPAEEIPLAARRRRSLVSKALYELRRAPWTALFGLTMIVIYVFVAIFAHWLAPYGEAQVVGPQYALWSDQFVFGTDQIGRDMLSRMIYGARNTVGIAFLTTALSFLLGSVLGLLAAVVGGWLDQGLGRFVDVLMAIPGLIFALVLLSIFGTNVVNLVLIIAV